MRTAHGLCANLCVCTVSRVSRVDVACCVCIVCGHTWAYAHVVADDYSSKHDDQNNNNYSLKDIWSSSFYLSVVNISYLCVPFIRPLACRSAGLHCVLVYIETQAWKPAATYTRGGAAAWKCAYVSFLSPLSLMEWLLCSFIIRLICTGVDLFERNHHLYSLIYSILSCQHLNKDRYDINWTDREVNVSVMYILSGMKLPGHQNEGGPLTKLRIKTLFLMLLAWECEMWWLIVLLVLGGHPPCHHLLVCVLQFWSL